MYTKKEGKHPFFQKLNYKVLFLKNSSKKNASIEAF
jgi:hypothetical protein